MARENLPSFMSFSIPTLQIIVARRDGHPYDIIIFWTVPNSKEKKKNKNTSIKRVITDVWNNAGFDKNKNKDNTIVVGREFRMHY